MKEMTGINPDATIPLSNNNLVITPSKKSLTIGAKSGKNKLLKTKSCLIISVISSLKVIASLKKGANYV